MLENSSSRILEVIKREDRLDKIARDIAHHFPRRGFLGKGMVVSVDKFTAVKMYDKVQYYWAEEKKSLVAERNKAETKEERDKITSTINFMDSVEMAVIISEDADEDKKPLIKPKETQKTTLDQKPEVKPIVEETVETPVVAPTIE